MRAPHPTSRSILSQLTTPSTRADVLAWYVTTSTLGSSIGSEVSGRILHRLQEIEGWEPAAAYHALFWILAASGVVNACLVLLLTRDCEMPGSGHEGGKEAYTRLPGNEHEAAEAARSPARPAGGSESGNGGAEARSGNWLTSRLAQISAPTRSVMYKLWLLLALDSVADGMVPYSLTNYYMDVKFHPAKSTLGDIQSASYFLSAAGAAFAGPLARKIGLVNTMVFTHAPSSAAVLVFPLPPAGAFWAAALLLLVRAALNNLDQAPRAALIAAVVRPDERTAVMGITSTLRTISAMAGPSLTGVLAAGDRFWVAFVVAGLCRLAYDFGLWALFVNIRLHQHEGGGDPKNPATDSAHDEEATVDTASFELGSVSSGRSSRSGDDDSADEDEHDKMGPASSVPAAATATASKASGSTTLQPPSSTVRGRSRSPRRERTTDA